MTAMARPRRSDGAVTRRRVLDAAVSTVLELGYYRASSNAIARRAGVTRGTIQHHFRTRQALLLEVLNDRWDEFQAAMARATIRGATLEERLTAVLDVLAEHYGSPLHLVQLQILLDLGQDPDTSDEVRQRIHEHGARLVRAWQPLFDQALGEAALPTLVRYTFLTMRGFLAGELISSRVAHVPATAELRRLLVTGIASTIRAEAATRQLPIEGD